MAHIFICYSRHNQEVVNTLSEDLEELGHTPWYDQELSGGQLWWDQILEQIRSCHIFIFALAPQALDSQACKLEYGYAAQLGKPLLPVLVAEGVSLNLLPPTLSTIQHVDYRQQNKKTVITLLKALNNLPESGALPEPLPEPPEVPISYLGGLKEEVETSAPLQFEEQAALVLKLKERLPETDYPDEIIQLLHSLRSRDDTLAKIANEIDSIIADYQKNQQQALVEKIAEPEIETPGRQAQPPPKTPKQKAPSKPTEPGADSTSTKPTVTKRLVHKLALFFLLVLHTALGAGVAAFTINIPRWNSRYAYRYASEEMTMQAIVAFILALGFLWFIRRKVKKALRGELRDGSFFQKLFGLETSYRSTRWVLRISLLLFLLVPGLALLNVLDRLNIF